MKKIPLTVILCSILTCSAFSCGSSGNSSSAGKSSSAVTEGNTEISTVTAADEEAVTTTLSPKTAEMMEKAKENMKKSLEKAKSENGIQLHNTDEMDEDAKKVVNEFVKAVCNDDAEAMAKAMYPEKMLEGMKACGEYDEFADSVTDGETDKLDRVDVTFCVKMKENENALAQSYMNYYAKEYGLSDTEYKVSEGYSFTASQHLTYNDGTKALNGESLLIVNIEGEGWKILPMSLKDLTE